MTAHFSDRISQILHVTYGKGRRDFEREARKRGIALDQLVGAAIAEALTDWGVVSRPPPARNTHSARVPSARPVRKGA